MVKQAESERRRPVATPPRRANEQRGGGREGQRDGLAQTTLARGTRHEPGVDSVAVEPAGAERGQNVFAPQAYREFRAFSTALTSSGISMGF